MKEEPPLESHTVEQHVAVEIMGMMPRLRDDLRISVQSYAGETCYVIEDILASKFYRLGVAEYTLLSLLNGRTTIAEAMGHTATICGADALSERETGALCKWILDSGLASTDQSRVADRINETRDREANQKWLGFLNPIMQKLPLFNPMPLLRPFDWLSNLLFGWMGIVVWVCVVAFGAQQLWIHWQEFVGGGAPIFAADNWIWLLITWSSLKLIHECSHAMACRKYRGNVREAGIVFIVFAPMPYVDVTSIWRLDSKWKRIFVSGAGMYAELFVASIAAIIWCLTLDPIIKQHCANVIVTATFVTLLFNANPLMRFDGYYMLADWLEMPNLATHGRQWMSYFGQRYFMGIPATCPQWPEGRHSVVVAYAVLSFLWRILITASIAISAEVLFHGAGVVLAIASVLLGLAMPIYRTIRTLTENSRVSYVRMLSISAVVSGCVWCLWAHVPWYGQAHVPIIVDFCPQHEIRCGVGGRLEETFVAMGDRVAKGQVLARLTNPKLETEQSNLRLQIQESLQRSRDYRVSDAIAAAQAENKHLQSLESRLSQVAKQLAGLLVKAPTDGVVAMSDIVDQDGTHVSAGDRLFLLGASYRESIYGLIDQADAEAFRNRDGNEMVVHVWGAGTKSFPGTIRRVLPRASTELKHPALGAHAGGPLSVRPKQQSGDDGRAQVELTEPHFSLLVDFAGCEKENVRPGQTGYARLTYRKGTVGQVIYTAVQTWVREKRQQMAEITQTVQAARPEHRMCDLYQ